MVDIRSPITNQILATYHEKTEGVWVLRIKTPPPSAESIAVDVQTSIGQGQALLDGLPVFLARARAHALFSDRAPFGIEYLYHKHALQLEHASNTIEHALTQHNITESSEHYASASKVTTALDTALKDLYQQSNQLVQRRLKLHPPTVAGVQWLERHKAITIKKETVKRRMVPGNPKDFLDEYSITDRANGTVLWYAHFHYSADWTSDIAYQSARLVTPTEKLAGNTTVMPPNLTRAETVAFYRSEISVAQANTLFFRKSTPKSVS